MKNAVFCHNQQVTIGSQRKNEEKNGVMSADKPKSDADQGGAKPIAVEKDFQMRIDKDGQWFHENGLIKRPALVALFSSVLSCDDQGQHWLRTPVEFGKIEVEDAAFVITKAEIEGKGRAASITLTDNIERSYLLSEAYPLVFRPCPIAPHPLQPYLELPKGVSAKLSRPVYYQLATHIAEGDGAGLWSAGTYFSFPVIEEQG